MQCRDICEMLSPYIDGMLKSSQAVQVEKHIAVCKACRLEYDELRAAVELVRGLPEVVPPQDFHDNLRQKIQSMPAPTVTGGQTGWMRRLAWGKWSKTLAVAAVLFLTVGITALWYDKNEGGLFDKAIQLSAGQNVADRGVRYGEDAVDGRRALEADRNQAVKETTIMKEVDAANNAARDTDRNDLAGSGTPVSEEVSAAIGGVGEQPAPALEDGGAVAVPAAGDEGSDAAASGGEPLARGLAAPEGQPESEDAKFSIMAAPRDDLEDERDNKPQTENNLLMAREYAVTLTLNTHTNAVAYWIETADRYGGFVEAKPQQTGQYWVLRIPTGNVDEFINELNNLGQAVIQSNARDLAADVHYDEEHLNALREREKVLVEHENGAAGAAELDALRGQIAQQQQALVELQKDIGFARFDLYLKQSNID